MAKKEQLYEVEIKSMALIREGQRSLVTYFSGGKKIQIVKNVQALYPQYTNPDDKPVVNITPITYKEYKERVDTNIVRQKQHLVNHKKTLLDMEELSHETVGN